MPTFKTLWDNFPDTDDMKKKCVNKQPSKANPFDTYEQMFNTFWHQP